MLWSVLGVCYKITEDLKESRVSTPWGSVYTKLSPLGEGGRRKSPKNFRRSTREIGSGGKGRGRGSRGQFWRRCAPRGSCHSVYQSIWSLTAYRKQLTTTRSLLEEEGWTGENGCCSFPATFIYLYAITLFQNHFILVSTQCTNSLLAAIALA